MQAHQQLQPREFVYSHCFLAPIDLVFRTLTDANLIMRWLGVCRGCSIVQCEIDLCIGGAFKYAWTDEDGTALRMQGVFQEIDPPRLVRFSETYFPPFYPSGNSEATHLLQSLKDTTKLTTKLSYAHSDFTDQEVACLNQSGMQRFYESMSELISSLHDGQDWPSPIHRAGN